MDGRSCPLPRYGNPGMFTPMEIETYAHGVPSWIDHASPDPASARQFYGALFGWTVEEGPPETGGYCLAEIDGKPVAGIGPLMNPGPPAWSTYVNVTDADAIPPLVTAAGGQVLMPPMDVMDVGRMAVYADPTGAVFCTWQAGQHKGAALVNQPNTFIWSELVTTDVAGAKAFYQQVFGWGADTHGGEGDGGYTEWQLDGRSIGGCMLKPPTMPAEVPPHWGVYIAVDDVDATASKVQELGGMVVAGPMDIEPGRFAACIDPVGAVFNVLKLAQSM